MADKERSGTAKPAKSAQTHSVDHHAIEHSPDVPQTGDEEDALRKPGSLPLETGNQYSHHKPEKT